MTVSTSPALGLKNADADVYVDGALAAVIRRTREGTEFSYVPTWIQSAGGPVASTLPVSNQVVRSPGGAVPPFFAGLIPEGRRLSVLHRSLKVSPDDELSLLLAIGADPVGNVQVVPSGQEVRLPEPWLHVEPGEELDFCVIRHRLGLQVDPGGLPGVQDKLSLTMISVPVSGVSGQYILKLAPPEFPGLLSNEAFFLTACRQSDLSVAEGKLVADKSGEQGLLVKRFDREGGARLAVEDGCQVMGLYPASKYSVDTEELFSSLVGLCTAPRVAALQLLGQLAFVYISANGDGHAKNWSIMRTRQGLVVPTPAYDLPSSQPYPKHPTDLALPLYGKRDGNIGRSLFLRLAKDLGVPLPAAEKRLERVCAAADVWVHDLVSLGYAPDTTHKFAKVVRRRTKLLRG